MRIDIVSILPEVFEAPLSASMIGIARDRGILELRIHELRDWTTDRHRTTDDYPFGGGPGMVMKPEPFFAALDSLRAEGPNAHVILLAPDAPRFDQAKAAELAERERLILLCGRYEGVDERVRELADCVLSIGDYVLTGGELAAMVVTDAVVRLLPGVLGDEDSTSEESFTWGLLEYPQYTRPATYRDLHVPDVLLSGDHARIRRWRRLEAVRRTALLRPELLEDADLSAEERQVAEDVISKAASPE